MTDTPSPPRPPRRPRYAGTHPRRFGEKYKELQGDPDAVARAIERGQTPAGQHRSIMLDEIVAFLAPEPGATLLDCTLGYGGHTEALARRVDPGGRVIALDLDRTEMARTLARLDGLPVKGHATNFAGAAKVLELEGVSGVHGLLADLGVSSMQLDRPERGFSLKQNGPLDMRMDQTRGTPAADWLRERNPAALADVLLTLGEEPDAERVALAIAQAFRSPSPPRTTRDLVRVVLRAKGLDPKTKQSSAFQAHPAARTFQAIRMAVNRETDNLDALLRVLPALLRPGGRVALLTFHSGEEKRVRAALEKGLAAGVWATANLTGARATSDEIAQNPRARSARLFTAQRAAE
ncbi:MAG: 16S rRNA (cytosine(1402)-N(4))-methyltransferase RsmH [Myxococcales bacterium]|nr:16S rRNA (cytosine(1402)-N(4))-methyltransferase RsmH [Myxococcales bacterium]